MEKASRETPVRTEGEPDPLAFLTQMQSVLRRVRLAGLERFHGDLDVQFDVLRAADDLMSSALLLTRQGKPSERFHSTISGSQKASRFVAESFTMHDGKVREVSRNSINPFFASISYAESPIRGLWVERIEPQDPKKMTSYKLVGTDFLLSTG
jgi:hypothetical protein